MCKGGYSKHRGLETWNVLGTAVRPLWMEDSDRGGEVGNEAGIARPDPA